MIGKTTAEENALPSIDGTELVRVAKGGSNFKTTMADIATYIGGGGAAGLPTVLGIDNTTGAHDIFLSNNGGGIVTQKISDGFGAGSYYQFANSGLDVYVFAAFDLRLWGDANVNIHASAGSVDILGVATTINTGSFTITATSTILNSLTASRALVLNASKAITVSATTDTELGYLSGVTSAIQTQLNSKGSGTVTSITSANVDITVATGTTTPVLTLVQAPALKSATTTIDVSAATAPTSGQVLTATSSTTATWQTPSSSGANTALSNLASVSINTSLLAQTGVDLGGTSNQFRDLYLFGSGTYGTTYLKLTGTPTSTRTWTIQDATDTFVGRATTDTLTNKKLSSSTTTIVDNADATKVIGFSLSGMTTAKTLTLSTAQTTTQQLNFPNITGTDTLATLGLAQTFTGANTHSGLNAILVSSSGLTVRNPANTFKYTITAAAIAADRTLNLPLITGTSTLACTTLDNTFTTGQSATSWSTTNKTTGFVNGGLFVGNAVGVSSYTYKNTNAGGNVTPNILCAISATTSASGSVLIADAIVGYGFSAGNGTNQVLRAAINLKNVAGAAGAESGDLAFYTQTAGAAAALRLTLSATNFTLIDAYDCILGSTTGTKWGTATSQKQSFWNATPIVQPTTAVAASTFVTNTSLIANDTATFDGYTIGQVVKALRNIGLLA